MTHKEVKQLRALIKDTFAVLNKLQLKYVRQEIQYKTIGASQKAIRANAERQELTKQAIQLLQMYDNSLYRQIG